MDHTKTIAKLELLHQATRQLMESESFEQLFTTATETASELLGFEYNTIRRYDTERELLIPIAASPNLRSDDSERRVYERGETIQWDAFDAGELHVYQGVQSVEDDIERTGEGSMMVVPLDNYGVLTLGSPEPDSITEHETELGRVLGANIETAIDRLEHIQQLRKREAELESKNDRLEAFAGKVSHELRNPLTVLSGRLELARETGDPAHLEQLEQPINRMDRLINDIRVLTQTGTLDIEPEPVDLERISTESWAMVHSPGTALEIQTSRRILADTDRLRQVIENLFRNSVEHAGNDVTVTVGDLEDGFYVEDDGCGIAGPDQQQLLETTTADDSQWTGFGLEVVSEIIDLHEWSFSVTETASGGARFEIRDVDVP